VTSDADPDIGNLPADVATRLERHRVDPVQRDALVLLAAAVDLDAPADQLQVRPADIGAVVDGGAESTARAWT
jgi:hypothetical protein